MFRCALLFVMLSACSDTPGPDSCLRGSDCTNGLICINGLCERARDTTPPADAGPMSDAPVDAAPDIADARTPMSDAPIDTPPDGGVCEGPCAWTLNAPTWTPAPLEGALAPTTPIRAAFDIEGIDRAYLLTDTTYHLMQPSDGVFLQAGTRSSIMPQADGLVVVSAYGAPEGAPLTQVVVAGAAVAHIYDYEHETGLFTYSRRVDEFDVNWNGPDAPARNRIQASWRSGHNDLDWAVDSATCVVTEGYAAFISDGMVHPRDFGACRLFLDPLLFADFPPFALITAPPSEGIRAAFYNDDRLWLFTE